MSDDASGFSAWVLLELMGHRRHWGRIEEVTIAGAQFLRLDEFRAESADPVATSFVPPASVYCITQSEEAVCRANVEQRDFPESAKRLLAQATEEADYEVDLGW